MAQAYTHKPCLYFSFMKIMNSGDNPPYASRSDSKSRTANRELNYFMFLIVSKTLSSRECTIYCSQPTKQDKTVSFHIGFAMVWWLTVFAGADSCLVRG